ncbi:MAG: site-specific DNA-methyltransferase [Pirellula sp.]|jgi:adenine-specific DNA-methyltransferase
MKKQKLELTWIGKETRPRLEPRILLEDPEKSYHAAHRVSEDDIFDNRLIFGDNLLALKALEQEFTGKIKCIYIDPPYNTGSAFEHYDDGVEHSIWLTLISERLVLLRKLLREDGSIWISIDDNECHYLKVVMDEIFGRQNFIANVIWQKTFSPNSTAKYLSDMHDHVLVYAKQKELFRRKLLARTGENDKSYKNPDDDPRGVWTSSDLSARNYYSLGTYSVTSPTGNVIEGPPTGRYWTISKDKFEQFDRDNRIWWGKTGANQPRLKRFLSEVMDGVVPTTIWQHNEVGHTQEAKKEVMAVVPPSTEVFQTPKPERLIARILHIATDECDLVLDSFAGSGTTGAVAHKMGRKWIMVELGEHCHTHIIPRLKKVIDGEDKGGVTEACDWKGGGGFRYYKLAPSLLQQDEFGNWIINKKYNGAMLAEALCKLEGFTYAPSKTNFWQHGHSTESDFIYVTTQTLSREQLQKLSDEVGSQRSLLICCAAYRVKKLDDFPNLTLKKIPLAVMSKCEWGKDDYSLEIKALPDAPKESTEELVTIVKELPKSKRQARKTLAQQPMLFGMEDDQ